MGSCPCSKGSLFCIKRVFHITEKQCWEQGLEQRPLCWKCHPQNQNFPSFCTAELAGQKQEQSFSVMFKGGNTLTHVYKTQLRYWLKILLVMATGLLAVNFSWEHEAGCTFKDFIDTGHCGIERARGCIDKMWGFWRRGVRQSQGESSKSSL